MHPHCLKRYSRARANGPLLCKTCNQEWPRDLDSDEFVPIGDKAVRRGEHEERVRVGSTSDGEEDEDEEYKDDEELEMDSQPQTQPARTQGRKPSKSKGKGKSEVARDGGDDSTPPATATQRVRRSTRR